MKENYKKQLFILFMAITLITALVVLLANIGFFGETIRESEFAKWGVGVVLAGIISAVVAVFKFEFLKEKSEKKMIVNVKFPTEDVDLNVDKCILEIRDKKGNKKSRKNPNLTFSSQSGYWSFQLAEVDDTDSVSLELVDDKEKIWKVRPFVPYSKEIEAKEKGL